MLSKIVQIVRQPADDQGCAAPDAEARVIGLQLCHGARAECGGSPQAGPGRLPVGDERCRVALANAGLTCVVGDCEDELTGSPLALLEAVLAASEARRLEHARLLKAVLESFPDLIVFALDLDCRYLTFNEKHRDVMRILWGRDIAVGMSIFDLFGEHPDRDQARRGFDRALAGESFVTEDAYGDEAHARLFWRIHCSPIRDEAGCVAGLTCLSIDITERKRAEEMLAQREREFRSLVEHSPDAVVRFGADLRRIYVNPAAARISGHGAEALIGTTLSEYPGGQQALDLEHNLSEVLAGGKEREFEFNWYGADGRKLCCLLRLTPEYGDDGTVESILAIGRDISELTASRQKIHQMAFYDSLTALPNRALFKDRLGQMIADASRNGRRAGVMLIDIDRFKTVNDTMGHAVGDALLCEAAARLDHCARAADTVARLGGDEFAILLPSIRHGDDLGGIAAKFLARFDEPFLLDGRQVFVSCSIGIAVYPDDSAESHDLVRYADSAMYFAKRSGRNNFRFYSRDLTDSAQERLMLESELRQAIGRGQLELYYQPKLRLEDMMMIGSEALLRWCHPQLGMMPPDRFIQVAEETGLIVDMGKWVLREACRTAAEWNAGDGPCHKVAVNLSARQFQTDDLRYPEFFGHSSLVNFTNWRTYDTLKNIHAGASGRSGKTGLDAGADAGRCRVAPDDSERYAGQLGGGGKARRLAKVGPWQPVGARA